jgi:TolA-binding protein
MRAPSPAPAAKAIVGDTRAEAAERNSAESASSAADTAAGTATQSRDDAFAEDVPPATADSPEVREAWLQRIRELAEAGNTADARASLQEFVRRYPNHPLPDDLRALLE